MSNDDKDNFRSYGHDLSLIKDDRIKALHSYWLSIHNGDTLPSRRQIDPLQFPKGVLGYVSMFDVIDDGKAATEYLSALLGPWRTVTTSVSNTSRAESFMRC